MLLTTYQQVQLVYNCCAIFNGCCPVVYRFVTTKAAESWTMATQWSCVKSAMRHSTLAWRNMLALIYQVNDDNIFVELSSTKHQNFVGSSSNPVGTGDFLDPQGSSRILSLGIQLARSCQDPWKSLWGLSPGKWPHLGTNPWSFLQGISSPKYTQAKPEITSENHTKIVWVFPPYKSLGPQIYCTVLGRSQILLPGVWIWECQRHKSIGQSEGMRPNKKKSDQSQISPPAPPEILHHTVRRTWLIIAYSDERWL